MTEGRGKKEKLRSGFTTGACAAAAAKAATLLVTHHALRVTGVEIPFPDGSRHKFRVQRSGFRGQDKTAFASVIKDAGDDPDVTNGAEIVAEVKVKDSNEIIGISSKLKKEFGSKDSSLVTRHSLLVIKGGKGVGIVTKPGLPVRVGEAAINPVPRRMIEEAVREAIKNSYKLQVTSSKCKTPTRYTLHATRHTMEITISVPNGEELAKKTLNSRLGIIGGISILGTTGIVKPLSAEAWTATIASSMDVAKTMGHKEIVLSAGKTSENAHIKKYNLPEECYVLMGDYLEFSLLEAKRHGFKKIHLCAQWAKMLKIAMATPQTHVRHGAIDMKKVLKFLKSLSSEFCVLDSDFNTARELFDYINLQLATCSLQLFSDVCFAAKRYAEGIAEGIIVIPYLVSYEGYIINLDSSVYF